MNNSVDLSSKVWCDLIFENKNKAYGAYVIRMDSSLRHLKALIIVGAASLLAIFGSVYASKERAAGFAKMDDEKGRVVIADLKPNDDNPIPVVPPKPEEPIVSSTKFLPPVVVPNEDVRNDDLMKAQVELNEDRNTVIASVDFTGNAMPGQGKLITDVEPVPVEKTDETIREFVEQMPAFPGGDAEMMAFLNKNIKYPVPAIEREVQGTVTLRFVVEKDGKVGNIEIVRSLDPSCDKEAVRVIKSMPDWIPGKQNGATVRVFYTIPVRFKLANQ
jgi:protein TonB